MTAGNDVVDLSKWNGTLSVNIGDAFSGDNDKVTVRADALAGTVAKDNLKLTSIENLEIVNSGEKNSVILKGANFKGLEAVKLIGDATILNVSDFTQGVKVDATSKADYIFGSDKADTINGGAGNDTIVGNDGNDVLTGGNGADEFVVGTVKTAGVDQILDFSAEDKISMKGFVPNELKKFDASTFSTVTYKTLDSVLATFRQDGANETKIGDVVIFSYDGKTYALLSTGAGFKEATDALVDITGANVASLTESNFGEFISQYNYASVAAFNEAAGKGLIPANTATIEVGSGDVALESTYIDYIKDGGILGETVSIKLQGSGETFDANDHVAKFASKTPALNITGGTGDDVITASSFGGTINGGSGNDKIDASTAIGAVTIDGGSGADSITGGAGNDSITAGSGKDTITGGSGNDTITLGDDSATDTIIFAATAPANGEDTITGFKAGVTTGGGDVLNFSDFLGTTSPATTLSAAITTGLDLSSGKNVGVVAKDGGTITNADIALSTGSAQANKIGIVDDGKAVVLVVNNASDSSGGAVNIYYVQDTAGAGSQTWDVQLVGKITDSIAANAFVAGNFA